LSESRAASSKIAYFESLNGVSAWWALWHAIRGWKVFYFDCSRLGRRLASAFGALSLGRVKFFEAEYQVGDYRGLASEGTRVALEVTEAWARWDDDRLCQRFIRSLGQPQRTETYLKKATFLRVRKLALRLGVVEHQARERGQSAVYVVEGSDSIRWFTQQLKGLMGVSQTIRTYPALPARLAMAVGLAHYYVGLGIFILKRGLSTRGVREQHLLAKRAAWPVGRRRSDDFLVDGDAITPSDLLLYYDSRSSKSQAHEAIIAAQQAGYETVAWDRVSIRLGWLISRKTINAYILRPLCQVCRCLAPGSSVTSAQIALIMLKLRRQKLGWDVFFERHRAGCLLEASHQEEQAAATMSAHEHGGISARFQVSDDTDPFNEDLCYLTHHVSFVWGRGVAEVWERNWRADEIVHVGYIWGRLHRQSLQERDVIRARYGATQDSVLVTAFDNTPSRDSFNSPAALERFHTAASALTQIGENVLVALKPKDARPPGSPHEDRGNPRLIFLDPRSADTNELIAAADLVVSMGQSSTTAEALVCGVPAIALDETGRDWRGVLERPDILAVSDASELRPAVERLLKCGIDAEAWCQIQQRIRHNYGDADGDAISRIRARILKACGEPHPMAPSPRRGEGELTPLHIHGEGPGVRS
jgi:hypothetical protein